MWCFLHLLAETICYLYLQIIIVPALRHWMNYRWYLMQLLEFLLQIYLYSSQRIQSPKILFLIGKTQCHFFTISDFSIPPLAMIFIVPRPFPNAHSFLIVKTLIWLKCCENIEESCFDYSIWKVCFSSKSIFSVRCSF